MMIVVGLAMLCLFVVQNRLDNGMLRLECAVAVLLCEFAKAVQYSTDQSKTPNKNFKSQCEKITH